MNWSVCTTVCEPRILVLAGGFGGWRELVTKSKIFPFFFLHKKSRKMTTPAKMATTQSPNKRLALDRSFQGPVFDMFRRQDVKEDDDSTFDEGDTAFWEYFLTTVANLMKSSIDSLGNKEEGGVTGSILPSSIKQLGDIMLLGTTSSIEKVLPPEYRLRKRISVLLDAGSGSGKVVFGFSGLKLGCVLGAEIGQQQLVESIVAYDKLRAGRNDGIIFNSPMSIFPCDLHKVYSYGNHVTHVYAFIGYPDIVYSIAYACLHSPALKAIVLVAPHRDVLRSAGFIDGHKEETDVIMITGMKMSGGCAYTGFVVPITPSRLETIKNALDELMRLQQNLTRRWIPALETKQVVDFDVRVCNAMGRGPYDDCCDDRNEWKKCKKEY